jgi:hypothetical protein
MIFFFISASALSQPLFYQARQQLFFSHHLPATARAVSQPPFTSYSNSSFSAAILLATSSQPPIFTSYSNSCFSATILPATVTALA